MRRAAKVDANHGEIVAALRSVGATVQSLAAVGGGVPDLLVGWRGLNLLIEVKDGSRIPSQQKLTPDQERWHEAWNGQLVYVVRSVDETLGVLKPMSDAELMEDLRAIDAEVARRKKAHPFEPYAVWAMFARQAALARYEQRAAD
jgi:hypothetical protein